MEIQKPWHLLLFTFPISWCRRYFRGAGTARPRDRAGGWSSSVCVVVALNEAARAGGIQLGMSETQAEEFSGVEIRRRSRARERALHAALLDVGWSVSPRIEDTSRRTQSFWILPGCVHYLALKKILLRSWCGARRGWGISRMWLWRKSGNGCSCGARIFWGHFNSGGRGSGVPGTVCRFTRFIPPLKFRKFWRAGGFVPARGWRRCRCCNFPSDWGRREFVCMNWRAARGCVRWCWQNREFVLWKKWNLRKRWRIWSRFHFY